MKTEKETKISAYLRLAELCGIDEEQKKQEYMKKVEELLNDSSEKTISDYSLEELFSMIDLWYDSKIKELQKGWNNGNWTYKSYNNVLDSFHDDWYNSILMNVFVEDCFGSKQVLLCRKRPDVYHIFSKIKELSIEKGKPMFQQDVLKVIQKVTG